MKKIFYLIVILINFCDLLEAQQKSTIKKITIFSIDYLSDTTSVKLDSSTMKTLEMTYEKKQLKEIIIKRKHTFPNEPKEKEKIKLIYQKNKVYWIADEKDTLFVFSYNKQKIIGIKKNQTLGISETPILNFDIFYDKDTIIIKNDNSIHKIISSKNEMQSSFRGEKGDVFSDEREVCIFKGIKMENVKNPFYLNEILFLFSFDLEMFFAPNQITHQNELIISQDYSYVINHTNKNEKNQMTSYFNFRPSRKIFFE